MQEKNLLEYLNEAGYKSEWVVVERNFEIIPRENLGNVTIQDNDEIEVLVLSEEAENPAMNQAK